MRLGTLKVFDDFISGTGTTWYSGAEFNAKIGQGEIFAVQANVTAPVAGTGPTLTVASQHSADGRNWIATGITELSATSISANGSYAGSNAGPFTGAPLAPYVRLAISLGASSGTPQCRLRLYVVTRST